MKTIGERIVFLREKCDITQKVLAKSVNITEASLSRYENNLREPKAEIVVKLTSALNTTADFLLGRSENHEVPSFNLDDRLIHNICTLSNESRQDLERYVELLKIKDNAKKPKK